MLPIERLGRGAGSSSSGGSGRPGWRATRGRASSSLPPSAGIPLRSAAGPVARGRAGRRRPGVRGAQVGSSGRGRPGSLLCPGAGTRGRGAAPPPNLLLSAGGGACVHACVYGCMCVYVCVCVHVWGCVCAGCVAGWGGDGMIAAFWTELPGRSRVGARLRLQPGLRIAVVSLRCPFTPPLPGCGSRWERPAGPPQEAASRREPRGPGAGGVGGGRTTPLPPPGLGWSQCLSSGKGRGSGQESPGMGGACVPGNPSAGKSCFPSGMTPFLDSSSFSRWFDYEMLPRKSPRVFR